MVKRKVSTNGDAAATTTTKKPKSKTPENGKLDISTPEVALNSLLSPTSLKEFKDNHWEKKYLHIKRKDTAFYGNLFSLETMKEMLEEHDLNYESDVNVCRYVDGEKEILNKEGEISLKEFNDLMDKEKATFQVHQPQRYIDGLWNLMEKMETYFGSLVGANVYITPADSQGLAPHCDDVEILVLQLEGKKTWKLYTPMVELSRDYTQDLSQEDIGEPMFEVTLEPGDLLYFPRGVIHQAKTKSDSHSTHISISTYQQHTWGDFLDHAVRLAIDNAMEDDVEFRRGLPVNYLQYLGTQKNISSYVEEEEKDTKKETISNKDDDRVKKFKEQIKSHLSKLVDHIDVNKAADSMSSDFMASRLPPFGHAPPEVTDVDEVPPTLESQIKLKYPEHVRFLYLDEEEEDEEIPEMDEDSDMEEDQADDTVQDEKPKEKSESKPPSPKKRTSSAGKRKSKGGEEGDDDEEDDEDIVGNDVELPCIAICHSLNNERECHMTGSPDDMKPALLKLPIHFARAVSSFLSTKDFVSVKDLDLEEEDDKLHLATVLFADDLVEIKSS